MSKPKNLANPEPAEVAYYLGHPIAFYPSLRKLLKSSDATVFFCQLRYWSDKGHDPDGWIYKTQADWQEETGLGRTEQETSRKILISMGLLEEKLKGVPAKMNYRINQSRFSEVLREGISRQKGQKNSTSFANKLEANPHTEYAGNPQTSERDSQQTITETTPENTNKDNILSEVAIAPTDGVVVSNSVSANNAQTETAAVRNNRIVQPQANSTLNDQTSKQQEGSARRPASAISYFDEELGCEIIYDDVIPNVLNQIADTSKMVDQYIACSDLGVTPPEITIYNKNTSTVIKTALCAPKQPKTAYYYADGKEFSLDKFTESIATLFDQWRIKTDGTPRPPVKREKSKIETLLRKGVTPNEIRDTYRYLVKRGKVKATIDKKLEIESIGTLVEKWDRLQLEIQRHEPKSATVAVNQPPTLEQLEADFQRRQQKHSKL